MKISKSDAITTGVQLLKYGVIGISNTVITLAVFYVMNTIMGIPYGPSNVVGYILGVINSFIWNRNWVFKTKKNLRREAVLFVVGFFNMSWLAAHCQLDFARGLWHEESVHQLAAYEETGAEYRDAHCHGGLHYCQLRLQPSRDFQGITQI
jgi:putative flippase GtrA